MKFICLTEEEANELLNVRWTSQTQKSPELLAAAIAAGFSEHEATGSPLGFLENDCLLSKTERLKRGARALLGTNGTTLVELDVVK